MKKTRKPIKVLVEAALTERIRELEDDNDRLQYKLQHALRVPARVYKLLYPKAIDGPQLGYSDAAQTILFGIGWLRQRAGLGETDNCDQDFKTKAAYGE